LTNQLPAYLQGYQAPDVGAALSANLGSAMPPHVSIEDGRFTLIDASNNEIPVPTFDAGEANRPGLGVYLDAAIIDVNHVMSRIYFAGAYVKNAEGGRPDCFSDNGIGPSISAGNVPLLRPPHPMAGSPTRTCAECPMSEWTKINQNNKKVPWCSHKQKIALLIPGFPTLFLLAVPPNSHGPLREYVNTAKGNGANIVDLITRIWFISQGTLGFRAMSYIDEPTAQLRQAAYAEKKTDALLGRNDVARPAGAIAYQPTGHEQTTIQFSGQPPQPMVQPAQGQIVQVQQPVQSQVAGMGDLNLPHTQIQPTQQWSGQGQQGTQQQMPVQWPDPRLQATGPSQQFVQQTPQQVQQPGPFMQAGTFPAGAAAMNQPSSTGAAPSVVNPGQQAEPTTKRRRRTAAEMQAANGAALTGQSIQQPAGAPQAPFPHPGQASAGAGGGALPGQTDMGFGLAQGQPASANPELATMLDDFFKQG